MDALERLVGRNPILAITRENLKHLYVRISFLRNVRQVKYVIKYSLLHFDNYCLTGTRGECIVLLMATLALAKALSYIPMMCLSIHFHTVTTMKNR